MSGDATAARIRKLGNNVEQQHTNEEPQQDYGRDDHSEFEESSSSNNVDNPPHAQKDAKNRKSLAGMSREITCAANSRTKEEEMESHSSKIDLSGLQLGEQPPQEPPPIQPPPEKPPDEAPPPEIPPMKDPPSDEPPPIKDPPIKEWH